MFSWRRRPAQQPNDAALNSYMDRLLVVEKALKVALDDIEDLDMKFQKMRGLIYAKKLHKTGVEGAEDPAEPTSAGLDTSKMTRDQLKRHLTSSGRFFPGKPPVHTE